MSDSITVDHPAGAIDLFVPTNLEHPPAPTSFGTGQSGSVNSGIQVYEGRAPSAPDDPSKGAISYPVGGGDAQLWVVASQAWV